MSTAVLMIGFKFDTFEGLWNHLKLKYFNEAGVTKNPNDYTSTSESSNYYKYKVYEGSIYENWYGWDEDKKRDAYIALYNKQNDTLNGNTSSCVKGWFNNAGINYIRAFDNYPNTLTTPPVIVGIPVATIPNASLAYKILVSDIPQISTDPNWSERDNCETLRLSNQDINDFKKIVQLLKIQSQPKFYFFNASDSTYPLPNMVLNH